MTSPRRLNNKFRFQLLQIWLTQKYKPCKVLDVGGGKGLLAYLLNKNDWEATVVDPAITDVLLKYKDLETGKRVLLDGGESFKRIIGVFEPKMVKDYDLIIGLHAHGSNLQIINACKKYKKDFVLLPCCVIDEPLVKKPNINWFDSLVEYARSQGFDIKIDTLNFKGQNVLINGKINIEISKMKKYKPDEEELEIEKAFNEGKMVRVGNLAKTKKRLREVAKFTIDRNKHKHVNG